VLHREERVVREDVTIGGLTFFPDYVEDRRHVHVAVRGHGLPGNRPLLGHLWIHRAEWEQFYAVEAALAAEYVLRQEVISQWEADKAEMRRALTGAGDRAEYWQGRATDLAAICDELLAVLETL
jgi:hypothetical protein